MSGVLDTSPSPTAITVCTVSIERMLNRTKERMRRMNDRF